MSDDLKESIQDALTPFAHRITEINPNTLTLFGLLLSLISAFFSQSVNCSGRRFSPCRRIF